MAPWGNGGERGLSGGARNLLGGSGWTESDSNSSARQPVAGKKMRRRRGTSVMEREQGGRGTKEEDKGHMMMHMGGQEDHQRVRSMVEAAVGFGEDEGGGGPARLGGQGGRPTKNASRRIWRW